LRRLALFNLPWCAAVVIGLTACAPPQLYTTAFPVQGKPEFAFAVSPLVYRSDFPSAVSSKMTPAGEVQAMVRLPLGKRCDLGWTLGVIRLGGDVKCALLLHEHHAFAVDAGFDVAATNGLWLHLPALYSLRVSEDGGSVTLIAGVSALPLDKGRVYGRFGLGFQTPGTFRFGMEFTVYQLLNNDQQSTFVQRAFRSILAMRVSRLSNLSRRALPSLEPKPLRRPKRARRAARGQNADVDLRGTPLAMPQTCGALLLSLSVTLNRHSLVLLPPPHLPRLDASVTATNQRRTPLGRGEA
jgi:hypothetical protein